MVLNCVEERVDTDDAGDGGDMVEQTNAKWKTNKTIKKKTVEKRWWKDKKDIYNVQKHHCEVLPISLRYYKKISKLEKILKKWSPSAHRTFHACYIRFGI